MRHAFDRAILLCLMLTGCFASLVVGPASPHPNVMVSPDRIPAHLALGPAISDTFVIPDSGSIRSVTVRGWRSTLTAGYTSAFAGPPRTEGPTLEVVRADLAFVPAAINGLGSTVAVTARIRYQARLLDARGSEIRVLAGTSDARSANVSYAGLTANASEAVEALYEELVRSLVAPAVATSH